MIEQKFKVNCGFFDSIDNDRLYSAEDMNKPYKRVITNGIFATPQGTPSTDLQVMSSNNGMNIIVKKGEGLIGDRWYENPNDLIITVGSNNGIVPRIDSVIAQVNKLQNGRVGNIIYREGTPNSTPAAPEINSTENIIEMRIANIYVAPTTNLIGQDVITDLRGSSECPWITSLIQQVDTSTLYAQWQAAYQKYYKDETEAFNAFMKGLTEQLSVNTNLLKFESHYTTASDGEKTIPISISSYNKDKDVLMVRVNRLFASDADYTISSDSTQIVLKQSLLKNQRVDFLVLQSVVVGDTATIMQTIEAVQDSLNKTRIVSLTGGSKLTIDNTETNILDAYRGLGTGFHTVYAATGVQGLPTASGAYRTFGQLTSENNGYIMAMRSDGSIYSNYISGGEWRGWKAVYESSPDALWLGQSFMTGDQTINPSKKLSDCNHGWLLVWSDYDDSTSTKNRYDVVTFCVPKKSAEGNNWTGSSFMCILPTNVLNDGTFEFTVKKLYIYNDRITGFASNNNGNQNRDVVLSAIYEY